MFTYLILIISWSVVFIVFLYACVFKNVNKLESSTRAHWNTWGRVSQAWKKGWKEMKKFRAFIVFGVLVWMPVETQTNHGSSDVHAQCFSTRKSEQMIMTSRYDIMRISHAVEEGKYKRRVHTNLGITVIWVFWYTAFGSISKPQTLYFGCLSAFLGTSIIRMGSVTCLSICMYPDLSGELLVSVTLVVWW